VGLLPITLDSSGPCGYTPEKCCIQVHSRPGFGRRIAYRIAQAPNLSWPAAVRLKLSLPTAHTKRLWVTFQLPTPVVTTPTISLSAIAMPKSSKPLQLNSSHSLFCNSASRVATSTRLECCFCILVLEGSESLWKSKPSDWCVVGVEAQSRPMKFCWFLQATS
jgi:hypothetical protein